MRYSFKTQRVADLHTQEIWWGLGKNYGLD